MIADGRSNKGQFIENLAKFVKIVRARGRALDYCLELTTEIAEASKGGRREGVEKCVPEICCGVTRDNLCEDRFSKRGADPAKEELVLSMPSEKIRVDRRASASAGRDGLRRGGRVDIHG